MSNPTSARTAAQAVYDLPHVRRHIFSCLERVELQSFLRADKQCGDEIREELYRSVELWQLARSGSEAILPPSVYAAVRNIRVVDDYDNYNRFRLYDWLRRGSAHDQHDQSRELNKFSLLRYDAKIFNLMVPRIRALCLNAREIVIGAPDSGYIVHCYPEVKPGTEDTGRIEIFTRYRHDMNRIDPGTFIIPPPSSGYNMPIQYNISLSSDRDVTQTRLDAWRSALMDPTSSLRPLHVLEVDGIFLSLGDITQMYLLQDEYGPSGRLQQIRVVSDVPWTIDDFRTLAGVASTSLRVLDLYTRTTSPNASYAELPNLVSIIGQHLPNLESLQISMNASEHTGIDFGQTPSNGCLASMGHITSLVLFVVSPRPISPVAHVNAIRICYRICGPEARLFLGADDLTEILAYLQSLSPARKAHMATVDMETLGVTTFQHLKELRYREDGSPIPLWQSRLESWEAQGTGVGGMSSLLGASLTKYERATRRVREVVTAGEGGVTALEEAEALLAAVKRAKEAVKRASALMNSVKAEEEISEYVELLRGRQA